MLQATLGSGVIFCQLGILLWTRLGFLPMAAAASPAMPGSPPAAPPWGPPTHATLANAGAETCKLATVVSVGPVVGYSVVGIASHGGLAAWQRDDTTPSMQRIAATGAVLGQPVEHHEVGARG